MERRCFSTSIYLIHISFNRFRYRMVVIRFIQLGAFKNRQIKFIHSISTWPSTKHTPKCNKLPSSFFLQQFQKMLNVLKGDKSCGTNAHCSMYIGAERNADLIRFIQFNRTGTFPRVRLKKRLIHSLFRWNTKIGIGFLGGDDEMENEIMRRFGRLVS